MELLLNEAIGVLVRSLLSGAIRVSEGEASLKVISHAIMVGKFPGAVLGDVMQLIFVGVRSEVVYSPT